MNDAKKPNFFFHKSNVDVLSLRTKVRRFASMEGNQDIEENEGINILKTRECAWPDSVKRYLLPGNKKFPRMTPGEAWLCQNRYKGSKPPRGKVYRNGEKRFDSRTWQQKQANLMEFLPPRRNK